MNKIRQVRKNKKESLLETSRILGCTSVALYYWETTSRIPSPKFMKKIVEWSNGEVQPNDFYTK